MKLLIQSKSKHFVKPFLATPHSAGYDLTMPEEGLIHPQASEGFWANLGFAAAIPEGYVAYLLPRSGIGTREGLMLNNTIGVIDADFRGEWKVCLRALNNKPVQWKRGDRLLQAVFHKVEYLSIVESNQLPAPAVAHKGFGSTDKTVQGPYEEQLSFDFGDK